MPFTEQEIKDKAKELGLELTDEQVKAYMTLNILPKKESDSSSDIDLDDEDSLVRDNDPEGVRKRIKKIIFRTKEKEKASKDKINSLEKRISKYEDDEKKRKHKTLEDKEEYDKLKSELEEEKQSLSGKIDNVKKQTKSLIINQVLRAKLSSLGCPEDRLTKAMKIIDIDKEDPGIFEWEDDDKYTIHHDKIVRKVETFKKENEFLFEEKDNNSNQPYKGYNPPRRKAKGDDEHKEILHKRFPALGNVS